MKKYAILSLAALALLASTGCTTQPQDPFIAAVIAPVPSETMQRLEALGAVHVVDVPASTNSASNILSITRMESGLSSDASSALARELSSSQPRVILVNGSVAHVTEATIAKALQDSTPNPASTLVFAGDPAFSKTIGATVRSAGLKYEYAAP